MPLPPLSERSVPNLKKESDRLKRLRNEMNIVAAEMRARQAFAKPIKLIEEAMQAISAELKRRESARKSN